MKTTPTNDLNNSSYKTNLNIYIFICFFLFLLRCIHTSIITTSNFTNYIFYKTFYFKFHFFYSSINISDIILFLRIIRLHLLSVHHLICHFLPCCLFLWRELFTNCYVPQDVNSNFFSSWFKYFLYIFT